MRVDLSSLGKGRGVDRVAEYLDAQGVTNYLIDLSGKLRARGVNARASRGGWPWSSRRPTPRRHASRRYAGDRRAASTQSVATAGDYRRFFETGGRHYSHIIDPRTGWPVTHATVSATAMAPDCMEADALATVLMAMPPDDAARAREPARDSPALLISRDATVSFAASAQRRLGARSDAVGGRWRAPRTCADRPGGLLGRWLRAESADVSSRRSLWQILKGTTDNWLDDQASSISAALAFYCAFSLAPLLIIIVTIAGWIVGGELAYSYVGTSSRCCSASRAPI